ncbi:divergent polysaccharide deacetylase family protein [Alsobacter sp. R-9]
MTIGHDDLTRPLGMEPARPRRRWPALPWGKVIVGAAALLCLGLAGWLAVARDPLGGEPVAVATIQKAAPVATAPDPAQQEQGPAVKTVTGTEPVKERSTAAELEDASGVKVVRGGGEAPESIVIRVPSSPDKLAPAPDKRLVERSRHGALPRIGSDGARPADVYARPAPPPPGGKTLPRIAIVIGGMGLSQSSTSDAITKLPGAVTLAFAPYGSEIERQVARARESGHEVMLQVPMEPFDYPENDPGPHTLTTTAPPNETMDRLFWVMSRFPGYIGVMNHMGGKFTSSEQALNPVLRELGGRGLVYLDDGSSARSLATSLALTARLPAARADVVIDTRPKASTIDEQLAKLEVMARERGSAVGVASGLPVSIDRIAQWSKTLEGRGIQLVPVSALIPKPRA